MRGGGMFGPLRALALAPAPPRARRALGAGEGRFRPGAPWRRPLTDGGAGADGRRGGAGRQVREALQTHITSSELGVLFMLAGSASLGPAAWQLVEDVCFWTANFSLPEFPGPC